MTSPEARLENRHPETPPLKKTQQEWTCDLCKITTMGESSLNAHLHGSKHKSKIEFLKASLLDAKDTGLSPSVTCETQSDILTSLRTYTTCQPLPISLSLSFQLLRLFKSNSKLLSKVILSFLLAAEGATHTSNFCCLGSERTICSC